VYGVQAFDLDLGPYSINAKLDFFDTIQPSIELIDPHEGSDIYNGNSISYVEDSARIQSSNYQATITVRVYDKLVSPDKEDMLMQAIDKLGELGYNNGILMEENISGHPGVIMYPEKGLHENKFVAVTWLVDANSMADTNIAIVSEYPWGSGNDGTTQVLVKSIGFEKR
jgi:hypothetical protein